VIAPQCMEHRRRRPQARLFRAGAGHQRRQRR
jgi:hypothetical protein